MTAKTVFVAVVAGGLGAGALEEIAEERRASPAPLDVTDPTSADAPRATEESRHFKAMRTRIIHLVVKEQEKAHDPMPSAKVVHEALTARRPRPAYSAKPEPGRVMLNLLLARTADAPLKRVLHS